MTWGISDTIFPIRHSNHLLEKKNKCSETASTYGLTVIIVNQIRNKKDLHQRWVVLVFGFSFKNLIKSEKILGYLFLASKFIE